MFLVKTVPLPGQTKLEDQLARMAVISILPQKHVRVRHGGRRQHQGHQLLRNYDDIDDNINHNSLQH